MEVKAIIPQSNPERLAYWYLRLNGFFLLENFIIHPDQGVEQRTDVDLFGVRFRDRAENLDITMEDEPLWTQTTTYVSVVIAEVKRGTCKLNGPWTNEPDKNMHRVLCAIGCFPKERIDEAAKGLYMTGAFSDGECICGLVAMGSAKGKLAIKKVPQVLFEDMIHFIHGRFQKYERQKASVGNWSVDGQEIARKARNQSLEAFTVWCKSYFDLP